MTNYFCDDLPVGSAHDCAHPWGATCKSRRGFDFTNLWTITQNVFQACANDSRLFGTVESLPTLYNVSLTREACEAFAGATWTRYSGSDIWTRLTTWKFPLLQLVASFPRPPLGPNVECFIIFHLLGDPVDSLWNLLLKLRDCQRRAKFWAALFDGPLRTVAEDLPQDVWKSLTLITDGYDEWDQGDDAITVLRAGLNKVVNRPKAARKSMMRVIQTTADALAADRATKVFPIIVALIFFVGSVGVAFGRTASAASTSSTTIFANVEVHSIAFSALYFWVIPAVFLSSVIGVSQTEHAIPRILQRFQIDLDRLEFGSDMRLPNEYTDKRREKCRKHGQTECVECSQRRKFYGGIYSWQPAKWQSTTREPLARGVTLPMILPFVIVATATASGFWLSYLVPPEGWSCRHRGEIPTLAAWLLSVMFDRALDSLLPFTGRCHAWHFRLTYIKDVLMTAVTVGIVIFIQVGIFNCCECYTRWGRTGLALPEMPAVKDVLNRRLLGAAYLGPAVGGIVFQLIVVPFFIHCKYGDAIRVFTQRDDGLSNMGWFGWPSGSQRLRRRSSPSQQDHSMEKGFDE